MPHHPSPPPLGGACRLAILSAPDAIALAARAEACVCASSVPVEIVESNADPAPDLLLVVGDAAPPPAPPHLLLMDAPASAQVRATALQRGAADGLGNDELDTLPLVLAREWERSRALRELARLNRADAENEARFMALSASIPGLVFRLRRPARGTLGFVYASDAAPMLLGLTAETLLADARQFTDLLLDEDRLGFEAALDVSARTGHALNWEGRIRSREGDIKWINLRATARPLPHGGGVNWDGVMWNITQSKRAEQELRKSRERLAEFSAHLEMAKEDERERIARDIHDELGGHLVAMKIETSLLAAKLDAGRDALLTRIRAIEKLVNESMATVGKVTHELRPGILKDFGLAAAIECQGDDFAARTGLHFTLSCPDAEITPPEEVAIALFRIFQETLTNVYKHARASNVTALLSRDGDTLRLEVADDGIGIQPDDLEKPRSFGLRGIRERVERLGGHFEIHTNPTGGTRLCLTVPACNTPSRK